MTKGVTIGEYMIRQANDGMVIIKTGNEEFKVMTEDQLKLLLKTFIAMQEGKPLPTQQVVRQEFNFVHQKGDNCMFIENVGTLNIDMRRKK